MGMCQQIAKLRLLPRLARRPRSVLNEKDCFDIRKLVGDVFGQKPEGALVEGTLA